MAEVKLMRDYVDLVARMRQAQKAHFRTKSAADLEKAEALEKEVDGLTKAMLDVSKMYKIKHIEEGKSYTNIKTGEVYKVLHIAAAAWDTAQVLVVYQDVEQGPVWVRSMTEFSEKFTEANHEKEPWSFGMAGNRQHP